MLPENEVKDRRYLRATVPQLFDEPVGNVDLGGALLVGGVFFKDVRYGNLAEDEFLGLFLPFAVAVHVGEEDDGAA